jgi:hypothetical protein
MSQRDTPFGARKELRPELLLQISDLLTQRGLLDMHNLRRPPKVQGIGDSNEVSEMSKLH